LNACGYAFLPGHRLRLAISTAYWPVIWPTPEPVTMTLWSEASALHLPVRRNDAYVAPEILGEPECASGTPRTQIRASLWERRAERDYVTGTTTLHTTRDDGLVKLDSNGLEFGAGMLETLSVHETDPLSARTEMRKTYEIGRDDWRTRIDTRTVLTATKESFHVSAELSAYEGETRIFNREWDEDIPRDGV